MSRTFRDGYMGMPPEDASRTQLTGLHSTQDAYGVKVDDTLNPIVNFYGDTVPTTDLKFWYDPNLAGTISGSTVKNGIDPNNSAQDGTWTTTPSTGTQDGKTYWDLTTHRLDVGPSNGYGFTTGTSNAYTVFTNFKRDSHTNSRWILFDYNGQYDGSSTTDRGIFCHLWSDSRVYFDTNANGSSYNRYYTGGVLSTNTWYTLILTQSGSSKAIYLNNSSQSVTTSNGGLNNLTLGSGVGRLGCPYGTSVDSKFTVFGGYNKVLNATERQALHNAIRIS